MEDDMARGDHTAGDGIETAIAAVVRWVAKEHTCGGASVVFVAGGGCEVWVAEAAKNAELSIVRRHPKQELVR